MLPEHVEHVRLVLASVPAPAQVPRSAIVLPCPHVVAGGHEVEAERVRACQECSELDVLVAARTRIRGSALPMLREKIRKDRFFELSAHVDDLEIETHRLGNGSGVALGLRSAATVIDAIEMNELEVRTENAVATLVKQRGGYRGVDSPAHGNENRRFPGHVPRLASVPLCKDEVMSDRRQSITTVHLGQYTRETANEIAGELEAAGIVWWYKEPGYISQVWEFGVRLFVDRARLAEARSIAARITAERNPSG